MQWPDTIAVSAGAAAGYEVGAARDALRGDDGRLAAGIMAAAGAFSGLDLPCSDEPDLFFAESPQDVESAKALCHDCPARLACLAGAIERREPWGVWGGELFLRGEIVPRKRVNPARALGQTPFSQVDHVQKTVRKQNIYMTLAIANGGDVMGPHRRRVPV